MKYRTLRHLAMAAMVAAAGMPAHAASLELDDCRVLIGGRSAAAYKAWKAEATRLAAGGDADATRSLAAEANNRLVCHEEAVTGDAGWTVIQSSPDTGSTETTGPTGIADIQNRPAALAALKDAVSLAHQAGSFDPGYRAIAATLVARYQRVLPDRLESAYEDAAGVYEFDCVLKRAYGRRAAGAACASSRAVRAQLMRHLAPERRSRLDLAGRTWAEQVQAPRQP